MNAGSPPSHGSPSKALPVYSDFSHMTAKQGIGGIRFAVSLREENPDEIIGRVFPMTKIVPGVKKEKKVRKVEKKIEEKVCSRTDCMARKEKMVELQDENKSLRLKLKNLEDKIETARNKIALTEKSIIMTEEKNDVLNGQIEDAQGRIFTIEADVEKGEKINTTLRRQLQALQQDIERIKLETDEQDSQLRDMMDSKTEQKLVFSKNPRHKNAQLASEVSVLKFPTDGDDSD